MAKKVVTPKRDYKAFYEELQNQVAAMEQDVLKFVNGENKAAGRRCRKALQEIKKQIKPWRDGIQELIKGM